MPEEAHHTSPDQHSATPMPLQPPFELQPASGPAAPFPLAAPFDDYAHPFQLPSSTHSTPMNPYWDSPVASSSGTRDTRTRGHSRQSSASSIPAYVPVNTGRRGSAKDPEALQAAIERAKNSRKKRTNSTASLPPPEDEDEDREIASPEDSTSSVLRQRQEDARLIRCDAEQQRRNELGKGYDRLRATLNRGDERLSKARVVERATARVVQLRDQNARMDEDLMRNQEIIRELNRANEQLMLEASGAAPLLASSPHSASSPSSGRPGSSSHTSVSAFGVGQAGHTHDRSSSLPTPPHTHTGLQYAGDGTNEFGLPNHSIYHSKQDPTFAYGPFEGGDDSQIYPPVGPPVGGPDFYASRAPPIGINTMPLQPRSESPGSYEHGNAFGLRPSDDSQGHWLHSPTDGVPQWHASSGLPGAFTQQPHSFSSSPSREGELSEVPAGGFTGW